MPLNNFKEAREKVTIPGWTSSDELFLLFQCVETLQDNSLVVELGTAYGLTAAMMSLAGQQVITIDNYSEYPDITPDKVVENLKGFNVKIVEGHNTEVAKTFEDESIDLLFIDADHKYESVQADIKSWWPKIKKGGKVLFHDYGSWPGVTESVNESERDGLLIKQAQMQSCIYTTKI